jgi:arsenate reductase-like glutaredoxin family protein
VAQVVLYTQPNCGDCRQAKEYLRRRGIAFTIRDVVNDPGASEELERLGSKSLATVVIDGEVFAGFFPNLVRIREVLGLR